MDPLAPTMFLRRNAGKTIPLVLVIHARGDAHPKHHRADEAASPSVSARSTATPTPSLAFRLVLTLLRLPSSSKSSPQTRPVEIDQSNPLHEAAEPRLKASCGEWPFAVMAMDRPDIDYYLKRQGATGITGRYPKDGAPEMIVSEPVARNQNLKIGDIFLKPDEAENFSRMPVKVVVGIIEAEDAGLLLSNKQYYADTQPIPIDFAFGVHQRPGQARRIR